MACTFVEGVKKIRNGNSHFMWMMWSNSTTIAAWEGGVRFKELFHNYGPLKREDLIQLLDK
jgi:uncharacterized protein (DUF433 family)